MKARAQLRALAVAIGGGLVLAGAISSCGGSAGSTDRPSLVQDVEYHGGLSRQESECIVDRLLAKFGPQSARAIIDASVGKPDQAKIDALPVDQRNAVGSGMAACGVQS